MKLFIASTALAVVLGSSMGLAASSAQPLRKSDPSAGSSSVLDSNQQIASVPSQAKTIINVMPAGQIVGRDLKDARGINAGKIDSLVIDTKSGAVEFVMIAPPASFNAHGQLIAAPWAVLEPPAGADGPVTTKVDVDKLAKAPRIDRRLIYELNRPEQRDHMYGFYGYSSPGDSRAGYENGFVSAKKNRQFDLGARDRQIDLATQGMSKPIIAIDKGQPTIPSALVMAENGVIAKLEALTTTSAGAMHDSDIYDLKGNDVGEFDETMIDVNRGVVAYILISHGGFLDMDENLYVAPLEALSISPYRASYRLTVNARVLEREPALHIERGNLPSRVSAAQLANLYQQFGVKSYWTQTNPPDKVPQDK